VLILRKAGSDSGYDWEHISATLYPRISPASTVLEIGASVPLRTREIARRCGRVIGVEYFPDRVPQAADPNVSYVVGDWQSLSSVVQPQSVDAAISSHVIEHIPDDLAALNELYAVLKPGGFAVINTPNRKRLVRSVIELFTGERKFPWWEHVREYTETDLKRLLERSRFDRYEIVPVGLGVQGGPVHIYSTSIPRAARRFATFWEIRLFRDA
jgi:ubiquinone/menaquinone biosynthesis C-methylase UbiE